MTVCYYFSSGQKVNNCAIQKMANNYSNLEMTQMHFLYGLANGNSVEARRLYQERYPDRVLPCRQIFINIHRRLTESGSFKRNTSEGRPRTIRTPAVEEAVLHAVEENPATSTRKIGKELNICYKMVWEILRDSLLYPYHVQRVQALLPRDFEPRTQFCRWYHQRLAENPHFDSIIMFTDEAHFSRNAIMNFHNNHNWAQENPHAITESNFQEQFSVNVWIGIIDDYLIGPFFLPLRLNGQSYSHFLQNDLPLLLEDVPLYLRHQHWFMHDGAPAHFSILAREYLNGAYQNRWIGRGGPQFWPPRSPDLNSLDFYLWGHLKALVYVTPIETEEQLRNRIIDGCETIRNTNGIFERVRRSMRRRAEACIEAGGGHFQHFL